MAEPQTQDDENVAPDDVSPMPLLRYARDNPLALVAGVLIAGVLLARFGFLGNPRH